MGPGSLWHSFKVRMTEILERSDRFGTLRPFCRIFARVSL